MKSTPLFIEILNERQYTVSMRSDSHLFSTILDGLIDAADDFCSHTKRQQALDAYYQYQYKRQEYQTYSEKLKNLITGLEARIVLTEALKDIAWTVLEKICLQNLKTPANISSQFKNNEGFYGFFGYTKRHHLLVSLRQKKSHIEALLLVQKNKSIFSYEKIIENYRRQSFEIEDIRDDIEFSAKQLLTYKVGCCHEFASLAWHYLRTLAHESPIEYRVRFFRGSKPFDHVFLVLMPEYPSYKFTRLTQFPADTIILDPWIRCFFTVDKTAVYWGDLIRRYEWSEHANDLSSSDVQIDDSLMHYTMHPLLQTLKIKEVYSQTFPQPCMDEELSLSDSEEKHEIKQDELDDTSSHKTQIIPVPS
jgi:hypothetical protein